jgi:hypothetical protein
MRPQGSRRIINNPDASRASQPDVAHAMRRAAALSIAVFLFGVPSRTAVPDEVRVPVAVPTLDRRTSPLSATVSDAPERALLARHAGGEPVLRTRLDAARGRLWLLGLGHVVVYDPGTLAVLWRVPLPAGSTAAFACPPDIALDASGTAFVANNVEPVVLALDVETRQVREYRLRLVGREQWDMGFARLYFASDGTLHAAASAGATFWRLDLVTGEAHESASERHVPDCASSEGP